jgi:hypothetical protein
MQPPRQLTPNIENSASLAVKTVWFTCHTPPRFTGTYPARTPSRTSATFLVHTHIHHATTSRDLTHPFRLVHRLSYAYLSLFILVQTCRLSTCVSARFTRASAAVTLSELLSTASEGSSRFRVTILPYEPRPLGCLLSLLGA